MTGRAIWVRGTSIIAAVVLLAACTADSTMADDDRSHRTYSTPHDRAASADTHRSEAEPVAPSDQPRQPRKIGLVVHVIDGDTYDVQLPDGSVVRIRPPQIDTPEREECGYDESSRAAEELLLGQLVGLTPTTYGPDRDPYDRLLRAVDLSGNDVGEMLVASGIARWTPQYADEDQYLAGLYAAAEQAARNEDRGFWATCTWQ